MALPTALLDANVLYAAGLRDFLLRLADQYLYAPRWSEDIHAEWIRSVLADRPDLTVDMLERTSTVMVRHFATRTLLRYYAKPWGIETSFRDIKDMRFGMGMTAMRIRHTAR